ncbi:MAG: DUF1624 domain-containing protein, partial [Lachnospiraceae bacterium]|nr:DUF1624 domain-containing protein [Lachnospiraceae bacterium]
MISYHACWDLFYIKGVNLPFFADSFGFVWQQSICWTFILLSGFCIGIGRHPLRRGAVVFGAGLLVSVVTFLFAYEERILFGVLTFLGSAMLIFGWTRRVWERVPAALGLGVSALLFGAFYKINQGVLLWPGVEVSLPSVLYANAFSTFWGFKEPYFFSTDYFSFFPWFFLFLCGYFLFKWVEEAGH